MEQQKIEKFVSPEASKRDRSPNYPGISLAKALEFLGDIKKEMSFKPFSRQSIAGAFGVGVNSGHFSTKLAAASHFGLIEGPSSALAITDLGRQVLNPVSDEARTRALQEAFYRPELYAKLASDFAGDIIPKSLANILFHEYGLTESAKDICARCFQESAEFAGLISANGTLSRQGGQDSQNTAPASNDPRTPLSFNASKDVQSLDAPGTPAKYMRDYNMYQVPAISGKVMMLQLPNDIDREDLISIQDQLEMIGKWIDRRDRGQRSVQASFIDTIE